MRRVRRRGFLIAPVLLCLHCFLCGCSTPGNDWGRGQDEPLPFGWERIEANQHYPSDVLGGMALGHFFGAFFTDAFLGSQNAERVQVLFEPARDRTMLIVRFSY